MADEAQLGLFDGPATPETPVESRDEVVFERSEKAQRYRLHLRRDGTAVATIPRRGSEREARRFVEQQAGWLERARERQRLRPRAPEVWTPGAHILWRGEMQEIITAGPRRVMLGEESFEVPGTATDLRPVLQAHFLRKAKIELPGRAWALAAMTGGEVKTVSVRNQRTRWGSCSTDGGISLNWRLILTPDDVRDYVILHELMHLWEMNHSPRFWERVEAVCPGWRDSEAWLDQHAGLTGL